MSIEETTTHKQNDQLSIASRSTTNHKATKQSTGSTSPLCPSSIEHNVKCWQIKQQSVVDANRLSLTGLTRPPGHTEKLFLYPKKGVAIVHVQQQWNLLTVIVRSCPPRKKFRLPRCTKSRKSIGRHFMSVKNIESQLEHHLQIGGPYDCYPIGFVLQQRTHWHLLQEDAPSHADATDGKKPLHSMIHKSSHFLSEQPFSSSMRGFLEKRQR